MNFVVNLRAFLIALWLGAAVFFSFAVAPGAFAVLPSRAIAGSVVERMLTAVNYSGLVIGILLLLSTFVMRRKIKDFRLRVEQGLLLILAAACAVGQFVVGVRLRGLREQIGRPIDELAAEDPLRLAFNDLHGYSVWLLGAAMLAAVIIFFLISRRARSTENWWR